MAGSTNHKKLPKRIYKLKLNFSWKNLFLYGFLLLMLILLFAGFTSNVQEPSSVPVSQIVKDVQDGKVKQLTVMDTKLTAIEQNGKTVESTKEANANVYTLFKDAGVSLDKTNVVVKDETGWSNWLNI